LFNAFVQDQITLKPNRVTLYLGSKFENNYFSGFDVEPSARLAWTPSSRRTFWAAVSRASRPPTRRDTGLDAALAALPGPAEVALLGNPNMESEHVIAYELGYRAQPTDRLSLDLTIFFNNYHGLESSELLPPFFDPTSVPPLLIIPLSLRHEMYGTTEGIEAWVKWKLTNRWTLSPGYSFLEMHLHADPTDLGSTSVADAQGSNPGHQAQLRSHLELSGGLAWDASAYFVGRLPAQFIASYTRLVQDELLDAILTALGTRPTKETSPALVTRHSLREISNHLRILLVEDNAVNQVLAARLLEKRGHSVTVAGNGKEALAVLERQSFDLVFMDVQMPEMDGLEATAAIRDKEKRSGKHLPVIAMTAHAMVGDRERCLAAGMDDYLTKPIRPDEIDRTACTLFAQRLYGNSPLTLISVYRSDLPAPSDHDSSFHRWLFALISSTSINAD
jgi:CheY-like chemotaxis protein